MRYYKQWKEHPEILKEEGEPVGWFEVTQAEAYEKLEGNVKNQMGIDASPSEIVTKLNEGEILHSSCAMYISVP